MNIVTKSVKLNDKNIEQEVSGFNGIYVVEFWADWSGSCHIMTPIVDQIMIDYHHQIKIGNINFEEQVSLAEMYGVYNVPTLLLFRNGTVIDRIEGVISRKELIRKLDTLLLQ